MLTPSPPAPEHNDAKDGSWEMRDESNKGKEIIKSHILLLLLFLLLLLLSFFPSSFLPRQFPTPNPRLSAYPEILIRDLGFRI